MTAPNTLSPHQPLFSPGIDLTTLTTPLADQIPMGTAVFDPELRLIWCNGAWSGFVSRYTGIAITTIVPGVPFFTLAPGTEATMRPRFARVLAGETVRLTAAHLSNPDGTDSWWDITLSPLMEGEAIRGIIDVVTDVTDRVVAFRQLEETVDERTRELRLLLDIAHDVAGTLELGALAGLILDRVRGIITYVGAAIFVLDEAGDGLNLLRYQGPLPQHTLAWRWSLQTHAHAETVIRSGKPVIIADVHSEEPLARSFLKNSALDLGEEIKGIGTWMGVPIAIGTRVIGMLAVETTRPGTYTDHHAELLLAVAHQAAVAIENARLYGSARDLAALEERQKLARELHDSVSQALYGIGLGARTARTLLDRDPSKAAEPLDYVVQLAEAGLIEMRALIFELRPDALATEGLVELLEKQAAALRVRYQIDVITELGSEPDVSLSVKEALYRISQEALHNIVKHAHASTVTIRLSSRTDDLLLEIADNGVGFDPTADFPGHLGLRSMRERAAQQGAVLAMQSNVGSGTWLRIRVPIQR